MSLMEITDLLNQTLNTELKFVKFYTKELGQLLYQSDEGAIVSKYDALHLLPLIENLLLVKETSNTVNSWDQWLNFLTGSDSHMPENLLLKPGAFYRLLKLCPVTEALQKELENTFLDLLELQVVHSSPQNTLWLIRSDSAIIETVQAFSETLSTEYEQGITLLLSNSFLGEKAYTLLPSSYSVILALENLLDDENAQAPLIFENHMASLLLREWDLKEKSLVEKVIRENNRLEQLDEETHKTIETLFKMNLNLTDTAKALFIHRNTLIYRLDKIEKTLGYDLRHFEDAFALKLMLSLKQ